MHTSKLETISATANSQFLHTLVPLIVLPYMNELSMSEMFAVMTSQFGSVSGVSFSFYMSFGMPFIHMMIAAYVSGPASLTMAKLIYPEIKKLTVLPYQSTMATEPKPDPLDRRGPKNVNVFTFASQGANRGSTISLTLVAVSIVSIFAMALFNGFFSYIFGLVGYPFITLEYTLGLILSPLAFVLG